MDDIYKTLLTEWKRRKLPKTIARDVDLTSYVDLSPPKITVVSGFRRTGKTYLLFHLMKGIEKEELVHINFEDERIPLKTAFLTDLIPAIKQYCGPVKYIFLDEVHVIPDWGRWLRRVYDTEKIRFFVTGSSSKTSSNEIPTELRGRFLEVHIFPLNFNEFLRFNEITVTKNNLTSNDTAQLGRMLHKYLFYGGLPEIVLVPETKKIEIARSYYNTVIRRDIIERFNIKSEENLKLLLRLLLNSTQYTISKLYNSMKSLQYEVGKSTIQTFIGYIESSYFMYSVPVISPKVKDRMQWPRKLYFVDTVFISQLSGKFSRNVGRLYENAVFLELKRRQKGDMEIFYWKNLKHEEVDFVVKEGLKVKQLIQVCYDITDYDTKKREIKALLKCSKELQCNNLLVITEKKEGVDKIDGKKIQYVPLWRWLLDIAKVN
jgi:uncharacterized protein